MELHFAWHFDADDDIERALMYDKVEEAAKLGQGVEAANRVLESWVLRSHGRIVSDEGCTGSAQLAAEYLEEIPDILRQVEEVTGSRMFVGVGAEPSEAVIARKVAEKRGGDPAIVLYTPDLSEEAKQADEMSDDDADAFEVGDGGGGGDDDTGLAKAEDNQQEGGEATQVAQGKLSPNAAAPSPPPSPGISAGSPSAPQGQPQQGGQPPGGGEPSEEDILGAIGQTLEQFKAQVPFFEEQVKKANPQAYQAVMGMVQGLIALAQQVAGGDAEGTPPAGAAGGGMQKDEEDFVVALEKAMPAKSPADLAVLYRAVHPKSREKIYEALKAQAMAKNPVAKVAKRHMAAIASMRKADKVESDPTRPPLAPEVLRKLYDGVDVEKGEASPTGAHYKEFVAGFEHEAMEHPHLNAEQAALTAKQHLAEDPQYYSKLGLLEESGVIGEDSEPLNKVVLPVGSVGVGAHGRSMKVQEPVTGKETWHQMASGRKLSGDGHALSTIVGECPSADTPESRAAKAGLVGTPTTAQEKPPQTAQLPGK